MHVHFATLGIVERRANLLALKSAYEAEGTCIMVFVQVPYVCSIPVPGNSISCCDPQSNVFVNDF